jgi:hypothetical protein
MRTLKIRETWRRQPVLEIDCCAVIAALDDGDGRGRIRGKAVREYEPSCPAADDDVVERLAI